MTLLARITNTGDRQSLEDHVTGVATKNKRLVSQKPVSFTRLDNSDISRVTYIIGASHDFGKATQFFQQYLKPDESCSGRETHHASLSAYFAYDTLKRAGYSDEIAVIGWYVVQRHHGNLTSVFPEHGELHRKADDSAHRDLLATQAANIEQETQQKLGEWYPSVLPAADIQGFLTQIQDESLPEELVRHKLTLQNDVFTTNDYYLTLFLYSVLIDADRTDSAGIQYTDWPSVAPSEVTPLSPTAVDTYKRKELSIDTALDQERERASTAVREALTETATDQRLYSLTMPTGSGKTLTALDIALQLRNNTEYDRPPRIIYSVPFLSVIDQNYTVYKDVLAVSGHNPEDPSVLLRHNHKSPGYAGADLDSTPQRYRSFLANPNQARLLTDGWNSEFVTTTFVQLFETLITNSLSQARRFHKLAGSVILLDEIQAVPTKYWDGIREAITTLTESLGATVILLTATNPLIFEPGTEITELTHPQHLPQGENAIPEPDLTQFDRVTYHQGLVTQSGSELACRMDALTRDVEARLDDNPKKDVMVVLNTVQSTRDLYTALTDRTNREIIYLSTRVLPSERETRIQTIQHHNEPVLVVTTQLVEAGVDIDLDIVYRDFAPIDSLVQTAGRCNREATGEQGEVRLIALQDTREDAPRDFHYQYVYDGTLTTATYSVLAEYESQVPEREFATAATRKYFRAVNKQKSTDKKDLIESMETFAFGETDISLIQQDYPTASVYIIRDDTAAQTYEALKTVFTEGQSPPSGQTIDELKTAFYHNVLSVPINDKDALAHLRESFIDGIRVVSQDHIGTDPLSWYHPVTGFRVPETYTKMRII